MARQTDAARKSRARPSSRMGSRVCTASSKRATTTTCVTRTPALRRTSATFEFSVTWRRRASGGATASCSRSMRCASCNPSRIGRRCPSPATTRMPPGSEPRPQRPCGAQRQRCDPMTARRCPTTSESAPSWRSERTQGSAGQRRLVRALMTGHETAHVVYVAVTGERVSETHIVDRRTASAVHRAWRAGLRVSRPMRHTTRRTR